MPVVAGVAQRFLCLATATTFGERDGESASEQGDPNHPPRGEWDLWSSPHQAELTAMGQACGRHRVARLMREAGLRVRSRKRWRLVSSSRHDLPIAPNHLDRQFVSDRANRHWVSDMTYADCARLAVSGRCARSLFTRRRRLGDAPPHAASPGARRAGDGRGTPTATGGGPAALGSRQPRWIQSAVATLGC